MPQRSPVPASKPDDSAALAEGREHLRLLRRSLVRIRALTAELVEPHGLTAPQFLALLWIRDSEGLTQVALSEELDSDQNTVSAMMRRLEEKGLVVRERHAGDGRAVVLRVTDDLAGSTAYFVDVPGFAKEWNDGDNWQAIARDEVRLMLGRCPESLPATALGDHSYFGVFANDDVDTLHGGFSARGARIISGPTDKPWEWREMAVGSPEGHRMMFAQSIE